MKVEALTMVAATVAAGMQPTKAEQANALAEAVDLALGFFADVRRIADAVAEISTTLDGDVPRIADELKTLAGCVDDNCQPALVVHAIIAPAPSSDD